MPQAVAKRRQVTRKSGAANPARRRSEPTFDRAYAVRGLTSEVSARAASEAKP